MRKALWENGKESMTLELMQAERDEILGYVQTMQEEKERLIRAGKIRRSTVVTSRQTQRS